MFNKTLIAASVATALSLASASANAVLMDLAGGGGAGVNLIGGSAVQNVLSLDWAPDNALAINALGTPTGAILDVIGAPRAPGQGDNDQYFQTVAQGSLSAFGIQGLAAGALENNPGIYGREFTFVTSFFEFSQGLGSAATSAFRLAPGESYFRIYADTTPDANQITGGGYADGVLILEGVLSSVSGNYTDFTRLPNTDPNFEPITGLDQFGPDNNAPGVTTHQGSGSNAITVKVTSLNNAYFLGDVTELALNLTYVDSTNLTDPFEQANPSNTVVGFTPTYSVDAGGNPVNGATCGFDDRGPIGKTEGANGSGDRGTRCDFHFQTDASGAFRVSVPEPGSLALIGLSFAALGAIGRRRKFA